MISFKTNKIRSIINNNFVKNYKTWATIFPFIDFDKKPKTRPGRWSNVGDFIEDEDKKYKVQDWSSVITTQDHCGDVICGNKESIIKAQNIISSEKKGN